MHGRGRLLRFRYVMPELFAPAIQLRRGLLRLRWGALQAIGFQPLWTTGATAGLAALLLTVLLFFIDDKRAIAKPADVEPSRPVIEPEPPTRTLPPPVEPRPVLPQSPVQPELPRLLPSIKASISRLEFRSNYRRLPLRTIIARSRLPAGSGELPLRADGWSRGISRVPEPIAFSPYREQEGLRNWEPTANAITTSAQLPAGGGISSLSTAGLTVEKRGPGDASPSDRITYELIVRNPTKSAIAGVVVRELVDVRRVLDAYPAALVEAEGLVWRLGTLSSGDEQRLLYEVDPRGTAVLELVTEVTVQNGVGVAVTVEGAPDPTPVPEFPSFPPFPTLDEPELPRGDFVPAVPEPAELPPFPDLSAMPVPAPMPDPVEVARRAILKVTTLPSSPVAKGEDVTTWFEVRNVGDADAEIVVLTVELPEGLTHHEGQRVVRHEFATVAAGTTRRARLITRAERPGIFEFAGELTASGPVENAPLRPLQVRLKVTEPYPGPEASVDTMSLTESQAEESDIVPTLYTQPDAAELR